MLATKNNVMINTIKSNSKLKSCPISTCCYHRPFVTERNVCWQCNSKLNVVKSKYNIGR